MDDIRPRNQNQDEQNNAPVLQPEQTQQVESQQTNQNETASEQQTQQTMPHKKRSLSLPILVAAVIAVGLLVLGYLAFTTGDDTENNDTPTPTTANQESTESDVDASLSEIDQILEQTDDSSDFPGGELEDQNLGL